MGMVDHSTAGAIHAERVLGLAGRIIAYIVSGHHSGLPDWQSDNAGMAALAHRLQKSALLARVMDSRPPSVITEGNIPSEKPRPGSDPSLWIRMLFSCLVDADYLDTENFYNPRRQDKRKNFPDLPSFLPIFSDYMAKKVSGLKRPQSTVNRARADVLAQCISAASKQSGIFTLSVPTGGGKTLSSMAFALNHSVIHGKRRIIYVIPYTSIIEQTADQFRQIFGENIVEHHSNVVEDGDDDAENRFRLACENWDAPIVITTAVQFFESLFAAKPSRCRKLHNIVNSVVILDEAQLLPPALLNPILSAIKELNRTYGVTFVLSTATQPALGPQEGEDFSFSGIDDMAEIIQDPESLHNDLKRVAVEVPADMDVSISWPLLADNLKEHPTVLCVVNRRDDCLSLYREMPEGTYHLSGSMCGSHRSKTIQEIKDRIAGNLPVRVISTQLVEAGVDLDFPVVYRALAGLDSIAQAAGRCNREGRMDRGSVVVFIPPSDFPPGYLRQAGELGRRLLDRSHDDPLAPELFERFFRELYWLQGDDLDKHGVLKDLAPDGHFRFSFRTAAEKFKIIDDARQVSVLVRYGDGKKLIDELARLGPDRKLMRRLQRYLVKIPRYRIGELLESSAIREVDNCPGLYAQSNIAFYHPVTGVSYDFESVPDPDLLMV